MSPTVGVFEVKLDKDSHGLGITIAGYTSPTGSYHVYLLSVGFHFPLTHMLF